MTVYIRQKCKTKDGSTRYYYYKLLNNKKTRVSKNEYLTNNKFLKKKGGNKIDNFNNVKKVLDINKNFYYDYNSSMGKTIDGMMSLDEHKVVLTYLQDVLNRGIKGDIVELGCYAGNTTIMMQKLLDLNNFLFSYLLNLS